MTYAFEFKKEAGSVGFGPVSRALRVQKICAFLGAIAAIILFWDVVFDWRVFSQRYQADDAKILSAISFFTVSLLLLSGDVMRRDSLLRSSLFLALFLICSLRLVTQLSASDLPMSQWASLLVPKVFFVTQADLPYLGCNALISLMLFFSGAFVKRFSPSLAFCLLMFGLYFPTLSALGYSYGTIAGNGTMAPEITFFLLAVGFSEILLFARSSFLRPFLTTSQWGQAARLQILCVIAGTWGVGYLLRGQVQTGFSEVFVTGIWGIFLLTMLATGNVVERRDRKRRALERDLTRQASIDPLTGLWNRRAVRDMQLFQSHETSGLALGKAGSNGRQGAPKTYDAIGIILADIDFFKQVNDFGGHELGDEILKQVSRVLQARVGSENIVARWGGEEFLILIPEADLSDTMEIAQVLRAAVASHVSWTSDGVKQAVTMSSGVTALLKGSGQSLERAIQDADSALFEAKKQGRNRVYIHRKAMETAARFIVPSGMNRSPTEKLH